MKAFSASLSEHASQPRNVGAIEDADATGHGCLGDDRPFCSIYLDVLEVTITRATFQTRGCGYAIGICSALTEWITGEPVSECLKLEPSDLIGALGGLPPHKEYCAELACDALHEAIRQLKLP